MLLWLCLLPVQVTWAQAKDLPRPTGFVSDFAKLLSPEQRNQLERMLTANAERTSNEVAVVITVATSGQDSRRICTRIGAQLGRAGSREKRQRGIDRSFSRCAQGAN